MSKTIIVWIRALTMTATVLLPIACVLRPCTADTTGAPMYRVIDLGVLPGFAESIASSIDRNGGVAGYCNTKKDARAGRQAFLYIAGKMTPVAPILSATSWSEPHGINASHTVVGDLGTSTQTNGFRLENGELQLPIVGGPGKVGSKVHLIQLGPYRIDKPDPAGYNVTLGHVTCINDVGVMGGYVEVRTLIHLPNGHTALILIHHAGIVRAQAPRATSSSAPGVSFTFDDLGTLGGRESDVNAINTAGAMAGSADCAPDATGATFQHACLFSHGQVTDLGTLGGATSVAFGINDRGDTVGDSGNTTQPSRAFLWHDGKMIDIGDIGGGLSEGVAINNAGVIVGRSFTSAFTQHGYVYLSGRMYDLNSCIPPSSAAEITDARAINDRGQIAATATIAGRSHAVVLTPVGPTR